MTLAEDTIKARCHPSCRTCTNECLLLKQLKVGGFGLVELKQSTQDWRIPFSCTGCNLCATTCNRRLSTAELMRSWRAEIAASSDGLPVALSPRLTDQPENIYAKYRQAFHPSLELHKDAGCGTLFFPGCALASYTPELAQAAMDYLKGREPSTGRLDGCCYDLLDRLGLEQRYSQASAALREQVLGNAVQKIVSACPTCHYRLASIFPELQVVSIYQLLSEDRLMASNLAESAAVHDACADRNKQDIGKAVRSLLPQVEKMKHEGKRSQCCGAGGGVSFCNPELAHETARLRLKEAADCGAQRLVVSCTNCALQLSHASASSADGDQIPVSHILELVFDRPQDYAAVAGRVAALGEGFS